MRTPRARSSRLRVRRLSWAEEREGKSTPARALGERAGSSSRLERQVRRRQVQDRTVSPLRQLLGMVRQVQAVPRQ